MKTPACSPGLPVGSYLLRVAKCRSGNAARLLRPLAACFGLLFATAAASRAADFFVVQANGAGGAYTSVNAAISAAIASAGGASGDTIEIRSNTAGTLQVFAQNIDLSNVDIASTNETNWLTIRVRDGDKVRFRTTGTLLTATGTSRGWKVEGNSLGYESLQFGNRGDFVHTGQNTYKTCYPQTRSADIASTCSNYAIRRAQFTGARSYAASIFDGTDYELDTVAAFDHGTNHYDINPNSGDPQDWGDLAVVRGSRIRLLNLFGSHGGHNNWKFQGINAVVRNGDFTGYWGDISPSAGSRATLVETSGSAPAPYGPVLMEGAIVRDSGDSIDNSAQAAMKTEGNHIIIRDSFYFDTDSHLWHMNFANAKASSTSYFSDHAFYHNTSYVSKGTWWNNFSGYNSASGNAQFERNLIANNLLQQVSDNDKTSNPAQILQYDTSGVTTNGYPNGFHGTVISGNAVGGPSSLKQVNLKTSSGNNAFTITSPPANPVDLTDNVYDNVITTVTFADIGQPRARTKAGFEVTNWGTGASAGDAPPLTVVTSSSSGTTVAVVNARPFYDGWGIRGEVGDHIYIGSSASAAESAGAVQVSSINYGTNVITLTSSRSVTVGDGVWFGGNPASGSAAIRKNRGAHIPGSGGGGGGGGGSSVFDANDLTISDSSGDATAAPSKTGASGGDILRYDSNAVGDYLTFDISVPATDTYQVDVRVHKNAWRGIFQLAIDNGSGFVNLGSEHDLYDASEAFDDLQIGTVSLTQGTRQFRFTVTGRNASSADYELAFDTITLTPVSGEPEVNVTGNGLTIVNGDTTPQTADNTDFGEADIVSGTVLMDFNIQNTGTATLTLGTLTAGGDFGVHTAPPSSIAAGSNANFTIAFIPTETGVRTATVSFSNDDADENPYTFSVQGTGTSSAQRVSDTFTDTDQTALASHDPDVDVGGGGWSVPGSNAQIMGNAVQLLVDNSQAAVINAGVSDAEVVVDYIPVSGSRDGLVVRYIDENNSFELNPRPANGDLRLLNMSGGSLSMMDSVSFTWTATQSYQLKIVVDGTSITGYVDGVPLVSATSSDHSLGTKYGLRRRNSHDDTRFDNFGVDSLGGIAEYTLTLSTVGQGSINTDPSGTLFEENTEVTLTAVPATGWLFTAWSGDLSGSTNPDSIVMNADKTVTATFDLDPLRVFDSFTDTDQTALPNHNPDVDHPGGGWSAPDANARIMANALQILTNDSAPVFIDGGISDAVVVVDYTPAAGSRDGVVARYVDGNNYFELNAREPNGDLRLLSVSAGTLSTLDSTSFTWTATQSYELMIVVDGDTITGYVDGVPKVSAQSTAHSQGTDYGLRRRNSHDDTRFDDFAVETLD